MPLSCDCYGGCWGDHSRDWPTISGSQVQIEALFALAFTVLPYGSFVNTGTQLHIETPELRSRLLKEFDDHLEAITRDGLDPVRRGS